MHNASLVIFLANKDVIYASPQMRFMVIVQCPLSHCRAGTWKADGMYTVWVDWCYDR